MKLQCGINSVIPIIINYNYKDKVTEIEDWGI